jgi:hypothetical protein
VSGLRENQNVFLEMSMKLASQWRSLVLGVLLLAGVSGAWAHGPYGHGGYYRHGGGDYFWGPLLFGTAVVGTTLYMSRPVQPSTVVITTPPAVVVPAPAVAQPVEAYYCRESGQYFPAVQTCPSPWMVVINR